MFQKKFRRDLLFTKLIHVMQFSSAQSDIILKFQFDSKFKLLFVVFFLIIVIIFYFILVIAMFR